MLGHLVTVKEKRQLPGLHSAGGVCLGRERDRSDSRSKAVTSLCNMAGLARAVGMSRAKIAPVHAVQIAWPASAVRVSQGLVASAAERSSWKVTGHTTPNLADVGGASVRLRHMGDQESFLKDGGYLLAVKRTGGASPEGRGWLPGIAGVPGDRGPDDHGNYRPGLAEIMVFGRPMDDPERQQGGEERITTLHHEVLSELLPVGEQVDVAVLARVTDFFLGLNSGQWLKIRIGQISSASEAFLQKQQQQQHKASIDDLLEGTGLELLDYAESPADAHAHKFELGTSFVRSSSDKWTSFSGSGTSNPL